LRDSFDGDAPHPGHAAGVEAMVRHQREEVERDLAVEGNAVV
jgi:hypothetical protein